MGPIGHHTCAMLLATVAISYSNAASSQAIFINNTNYGASYTGGGTFYGGRETILVNGGGKLHMPGSWKYPFVVLGWYGGTPDMTVTGSGSQIDIDGYLRMGNFNSSDWSSATVNVLDNGVLNVRGGVVVARTSHDGGTVNVRDGGTLNGNVWVGVEGNGELHISSGGKVNGDVTVGGYGYSRPDGDLPGKGKVTIDGPDTAVTGTLSISHGTVTLTNEGLMRGKVKMLTSDAQLNVGDGKSNGRLEASEVDFGATNAQLTFNNPQDQTFSGTLTGKGILTKKGAGSLKTTADSSKFEGTTTVEEGTLDVSTPGAKLGGTVTARRGAAILGNARQLVGTIVSEGVIIIDQKVDGAYEGRIAGSGQVRKIGDGTLFVSTGLEQMSGTLDLEAGAMSLRDHARIGTSQSTINVASQVASPSVALRGTGTLGGNLNVAAGGAVSPGESDRLGTLTVEGNYAAKASSTYQVKIDPATANSDQLRVKGTATIEPGARLEVTALQSNDFVPERKYLILQADGGRTGRYELANDGVLSLFYRIRDDYSDPHRVYLINGQATAFATVADSSTQYAAATGLQSLASGDPLRTAVSRLKTMDQARQVFDQVSGSFHSSAKAAMLSDSRYVRDAVLDRMREATAGSDSATNDQDGVSTGEACGALGAFTCPTAWFRGYGSWDRASHRGAALGIDRNVGGFVIGSDVQLGDWTVGLLGGYGHTDFKATTRTLGSGAADAYTLGAYAARNWRGIGIRTGATITRHEIKSRRSVAFEGF